MTEGSQSNAPVQDIILDTCILQYFGNKHLAYKLKIYLIGLIGRRFDLAISEVTIAELLCNLSKKKEEEGRNTLLLFKRYPVENKVLVASAQLPSLFNQVQIDNFEKIKIQTDHISLADRIIGATAVLTGSLILSTNIQDFPNPYFLPVEENQLIYKKKDKMSMLYLQLLSPNTKLIMNLFNKRK